MITREEFQILYDQGPDAVYEFIVALHSAMQAQIDTLTARVQELEARLNKDSHNSSKPPSLDGLAKKPRSLRPNTGRRSGGQHGHPGRTLEFAELPDHIVLHVPTQCQACGASLEQAPVIPVIEVQRRQVLDLPPLKLEVTEHQVQSRCCPHCGHQSCGEFPAQVPYRVQYGGGIKALWTYLMHYQLLPLERVRELMGDLFGAPVSEGTLHNITQEAFVALDRVESNIYDALCKAPVAHFDETGLRIAGKLHWLHVTSTPTLTYYCVHAKRGPVAMEAIGILPQFRGRAIHDGLPAYTTYGCRHGLCNAHHLRELMFMEEQHHQPWAKPMRELLCEIKEAVQRARDCGQTRLHPLLECRFEARYTTLLKIGYAANPPPEPTGKKGRPKQGPARSLLLRLDQARKAVLAFMYDFDVPFDNNQAERDLRMMKVKQKVSGCFRSEGGAKAFCRLRGYISTLRKQGAQVLSALRQLYAGTPIRPALATE
jgi:transposase